MTSSTALVLEGGDDRLRNPILANLRSQGVNVVFAATALLVAIIGVTSSSGVATVLFALIGLVAVTQLVVMAVRPHGGEA